MELTALWQQSAEWMCTWDLGRRCNLDCTYCPPHRHDNRSPHASFEELVKTAQLPISYTQILKEFAKDRMEFQINFTGGEPTLNPNFLDFIRYLHQHAPHISLSLTTNGLFPQSSIEALSEHLHGITISYHCEASAGAKEHILKNLYDLHEKVKTGHQRLRLVNVNLMAHSREDYFAECKALAQEWTQREIPFIARRIGEHANDPTAHKYSTEQLLFFVNQWSSNQKSSIQKCGATDMASPSAEKVGRPCCGGRKFKQIYATQEKLDQDGALSFLDSSPVSMRVQQQNFKNWYCLVNLFFLHIHQESGDIYYHQTCQANHEGRRGPMGSIKNIDGILQKLKTELAEKKIKPIRCPNTHCNCGLCITKSSSLKVVDDFVRQLLPGMEVQI